MMYGFKLVRALILSFMVVLEANMTISLKLESV